MGLRWTSTGALIILLSATTLGFGVSSLSLSRASASPSTVDYLALGDSVPVWEGNNSYPYLMGSYYGLQVVDMAVSGETTTSMLDGGQMSRAVSFLEQHANATVLITIDIGGNDLLPCVSGTSADLSCIQQAESTMVQNLDTILSKLRQAAGPKVPIVGMNYYDPFLGDWLAGGATQEEAELSVQLVTSLNNLLAGAYQQAGAPVADVASAFDTTDLTDLVSSQWGQIPLAVDKACTLLDIGCQLGQTESFGDDPNDAGEAVIAQAFEKAIGSTITPITPSVTGPYELYCPHTPVGDLVFNDVTTSATITPSTLSAGGQFQVTDYQTDIPVPSGAVSAAAGLGNSSFEGLAASAVDAYGATPTQVATGSMGFDLPIPNPAQALTLDIPSSPTSIGPFTASGGSITIAQDQSTLVVAELSGKAFKMSCTSFPNDSIASSGPTSSPPPATPILPIIAISSASGTPPSTTPPGTPNTGNQTPGAPYELYCPGTPVGDISINDVVTTGSIKPTSLNQGEQFQLTDLQTQFTIPQTVAQQAESLGLTTLNGTLFAFANASGVEGNVAVYPGPHPGPYPVFVPIPFSFDEVLPTPVPSAGVQFTASPPAGFPAGSFTAAGGPIKFSVSAFNLDVTAFGDQFGLFCNTYANDSEATGLATHPPVTAPIEPVIVTASAVPTTSPTGGCVTAGVGANGDFVDQLYVDLLHRTPDPGGLNTFLLLMNTGASCSQVAYDIATSSEYRTDLVNNYYEKYLGRAPDPGGLSLWVGDLNAGASDESVQAGILGSDEYYSDSGGAPIGFVTALYQALLGRAPDPGGLASWESQLAAGVSRTALASGILNSNEYRIDLVNGYYQALLGRAGDPGGLSFWVNQLARGTSDEAVLAGIAGSAEFYSDTTGT